MTKSKVSPSPGGEGPRSGGEGTQMSEANALTSLRHFPSSALRAPSPRGEGQSLLMRSFNFFTVPRPRVCLQAQGGGSPAVVAIGASRAGTELRWGSPIKSGNTGFVERGNS